MNFDDPAVQRMLAVGNSSAETRVVDTGGMILLSNDKEETGRYVNYIDEMEKGIQIFTNSLIIGFVVVWTIIGIRQRIF